MEVKTRDGAAKAKIIDRFASANETDGIQRLLQQRNWVTLKRDSVCVQRQISVKGRQLNLHVHPTINADITLN